MNYESMIADNADEQFTNYKEQSEQQVARLRKWNPGDTLWGYEVVAARSASGKTYREGSELLDSDIEGIGDKTAEEKARTEYHSRAEGDGYSDTVAVFLYSATVESVRTNPRDPGDIGEPPLQFAELSAVTVHDWTILGERHGDGPAESSTAFTLNDEMWYDVATDGVELYHEEANVSIPLTDDELDSLVATRDAIRGSRREETDD